MAEVLTVAQLERLLERQRRRLQELHRRRDRLRKELAQVEARITEISGLVRAGEGPRRRRKRPRNSTTLLEAVVNALRPQKKGLALRELAAKIVENGYKTTSENFENTVYQIIYNNKDRVAHDPQTRTYRLRKES